MRRLGVFERGIVFLGSGGAWLFLIAVLLSAYEVVMRYVFNAPSAWIHNTTTTLCVVAFAVGGAYCMIESDHIRITFVLDRTKGRTRHGLEILALVIGVFYLAGLAYALVRLANEAVWRFNFEGRWTPELTAGPPEWPLPSIVKASLTLGALLFLAVAASISGDALPGAAPEQ